MTEKQSNGWLGAILCGRSGAEPDAQQIADATVAMWHDIAGALQPIIGKHGFAALYNRSAALTARKYPWVANARVSEDHTAAFDQLQLFIARQTIENAARGAGQLLETFYDVLASLIGPLLCEQLLAAVRDKPVGADGVVPSHER